MVSSNEVLLSVKSLKDVDDFFFVASKSKVTNKVDNVFRGNDRVMAFDQSFIHRPNIIEWSIRVLNNVRVKEMMI
jgi:hypothetical protein